MRSIPPISVTSTSASCSSPTLLFPGAALRCSSGPCACCARPSSGRAPCALCGRFASRAFGRPGYTPTYNGGRSLATFPFARCRASGSPPSGFHDAGTGSAGPGGRASGNAGRRSSGPSPRPGGRPCTLANRALARRRVRSRCPRRRSFLPGTSAALRFDSRFMTHLFLSPRHVFSPVAFGAAMT